MIPTFARRFRRYATSSRWWRVVAACAGVIAVSGVVRAEIVQTNAASRSETAFIASAFDLINSGAGSLASTTRDASAADAEGGREPTSAANLNDGKTGHPSALQRVSPDDARITYSDYARLVRLDASEARFDRPITGVRGGRENANPAARVRFRTDATMITASFTTGTMGIMQGTGVILVDGARAGTFDASVSGSTLKVDVPVGGAGYRDVELLLPYSQDVRFTGLLVNGEAGFESVTARSPIRYVAYGDSITQGFWSSDSYASYPSLVGRQNDWEVVNMGVGSRGLKDSGFNGADGAAVASLGADVISVMAGHNDAAARISAPSYRALMEAFVAQVREVDGTVPIYLISPIFTANAAIQPRLREYRDEIMGFVNDSPDSNLHWIDGLTLGIDATNVRSYTSDGVHPNDAGAALLASNLAPWMSPSSRLQSVGLKTDAFFMQTQSMAGGPSIQLQVVPEPAAMVMVFAAAVVLLPRFIRRSS